jgi:predicted ATPase
MIHHLSIKGFKRFQDERFELRSLTVLAGRNGAGKTSTIHALLLARHATLRADNIAELNGPFGLELGWFDDIINVNADKSFSIALEDHAGGRAVWTFVAGNTELYAKVSLPRELPKIFSPAAARGFQYLSAERIGPRITQKAAALPQELLEIGSAGQHVAQVLEKLGRQIVPIPRRIDKHDPEEFFSVKAQTERWLSHIVRNIQFDTTVFPGTDVLSLRFRNDGASPWVRPTNMGFGISYSLPIITAAMTAPEDALLIVENPEAHLHPAGQSEIGIFLTRMAAAGLQIIVETHSDHVLNGIRRAIGESKSLSADDAIVHYFPDGEAPIQPLTFTPTGGISEWPLGFFDQYQMDIANISRIRRPR